MEVNMSEVKILRINDLVNLLGLSKVTIWRMEHRGQFPKRIKLTDRIVGWRESDVLEWIKKRQGGEQ